MSVSVFLSHNSKDKPFVRKLAKDLKAAGAIVWIDEAEIKIGDSIIDKIESGIIRSDYVAVILSPNSVESNWVKVELRAFLTSEIHASKVRVLPILYKDCDIPPFLQDKRYADFRPGKSYRTALKLVLKRLELSYFPVELTKLQHKFKPLEKASELLLALESDEERKRYAGALSVSISPESALNTGHLAVPMFIELEFGIDRLTQTKYFVSLNKGNSYRFIRSLGVPWWKTKGFKRKGFVKHYVDHFNRNPCRGEKRGETPVIYSYGELLEWFEVPTELLIPEPLQQYV